MTNADHRNFGCAITLQSFECGFECVLIGAGEGVCIQHPAVVRFRAFPGPEVVERKRRKPARGHGFGEAVTAVARYAKVEVAPRKEPTG